MAKEIKFNIRLNVDGKEQLATAATSIQEISEAVNTCHKNARDLNDAIIDFNQKIEKYRNIADSISQVSQALASTARQSMAVTQLTGETGDAMRSLRSEVAAVAEYYGKDFAEVLRSANAMAKGFGISAQQAMALVRSGFAAGADAGGDFLDTLREYPRYFSEAGISAEAFVAITTNAARQGVFSDKGVDAIKEANIRLRELTPATKAALEGIGMSAEAVQQALRDGSATTFQVMQQVAERLATLPASSAEVGAALADIFGAPGEDAGLEYIKTLATVETSMDAVKAATGGVAEAQDRQVAAIERVKNAITGIVDISGLYNMAAPFITTAEKAGNAVVAVLALSTAFGKLRVAIPARQIVSAIRNFIQYGTTARTATAANATLAASFRGVSVAANTMKMAVRAALATSVIGVAVVALGKLLEMLMGAFDRAGDAAEEAEQKFQGVAEAEGEYVRVAAEAQVQIENEAKRLKQLMDAKADTTAAVARLNEAYSESFGTYETAAEWYDVLTRKSKDYARAKGYEAQSIAAATRLSEISFKLEQNYASRRKLWREGKAVEKKTSYSQLGPGTPGHVYSTEEPMEEYAALKSEGAELIAERKELEAVLDFSSKELEKLATSMGEVAGGNGNTGNNGNNANGTGNTHTGTAPPASAPAYDEGSVKWSEARLRELERPDLTMARAGLHDLKVRIGLEDPAAPVAIAHSVNEQLQAELKPVVVKVDTSGVDKSRDSIAGATEALRAMGGAFSSMGSNLELPALDVAGTIASAIATTIMGFAQASSKESKLGVWGWIAASVAGLANLMAIVGSIKSMGAFSQGGVVGGASPTGDRLLARVNSGEMILNRRQQQNLLRLLGSATAAVRVPQVATVRPVGAGNLDLSGLGAVEAAPVALDISLSGRLHGQDLVLAAANYTRRAAKSGRRSGIVV